MKKTALVGIIIITTLVVLAVGAFVWQGYAPGPVSSVPKGATVIDLRDRGLASIPAEIGEYTSAIQLLLDDNLLSGALPAEIRKMQKLEVISAKNNRLTGIPAEIGQLRNLKTIDFTDNQINTYPNELLQLQQPLKLFLDGNPFTLEQITTLRQAMPNATISF